MSAPEMASGDGVAHARHQLHLADVVFGVARAECFTRGSVAYLVGIRRGNRVEISLLDSTMSERQPS